MTLPYLLLDIDGVLIPFPAADGTTPPTHLRHTVRPTGRSPDKPVDVWLDPAAVVWIDDDFTSLDHAWAAERTARGNPTLLVQPDPYTGLRTDHLTEVRDWAAGVWRPD
ncbi:hypothetical protein [Streptomyces sp. NBC_01716]|uniref:hypothetical protein n=1 Tax=Streptomyces sp. NBC_01716 TaxID=2975917 RepID=UPI002E2EC442|nr:hypothetical protein [Streptomyces sp. NBC_01716]